MPSKGAFLAVNSEAIQARDRWQTQKKTRWVIVHSSPSAPRVPEPVPDTNITAGFQSLDIHTCEGTGAYGYGRWGSKHSQGTCRGMAPLCLSEKSSKSKLQCEWGRQGWLCKSADSHSWGTRTGTKRSLQPGVQPVPACRVLWTQAFKLTCLSSEKARADRLAFITLFGQTAVCMTMRMKLFY